MIYSNMARKPHKTNFVSSMHNLSVKSLKLVWRVILPPILQMRKQVQGAYASNQVCYISTLALSHHWRQSQITAQNRILNFLPRCHFLHIISYTLLIYQEYISDGWRHCSNVGFQEMVHFPFRTRYRSNGFTPSVLTTTTVIENFTYFPHWMI